jgi:hypothetical protein
MIWIILIALALLIGGIILAFLAAVFAIKLMVIGIGILIVFAIVIYIAIGFGLAQLFGPENADLALLTTLLIGTGVNGLFALAISEGLVTKQRKSKIAWTVAGCFVAGILLSTFTDPNIWTGKSKAHGRVTKSTPLDVELPPEIETAPAIRGEEPQRPKVAPTPRAEALFPWPPVEYTQVPEQPIKTQTASITVPPVAAKELITVAEAQKIAVQRYPELGVAGSTVNTEFIARYKLYQQSRPDYFQDTSWPLRLVEEIVHPPQTK